MSTSLPQLATVLRVDNQISCLYRMTQ